MLNSYIMTRRRKPRGVDRALDRQRTAIGRELHDSIGQQLTGLGLLAQGLSSSLEGTDDNTREGMARLVAGLRQTLADVRSISHGLSDDRASATGLAESLDRLARRIRLQTTVDCDFEQWQGADVAEPRTIRQMVRIAQEAIQNSLRHAEPESIKLVLQRDGDKVRLVVKDDGRGLSSEGVVGGFGIRSMWERARSIGARLDIRSKGRTGTVVSCTLGEEMA